MTSQGNPYWHCCEWYGWLVGRRMFFPLRWDWMAIILSCLVLDTSAFIQQLYHAELRMPQPMANVVLVEDLAVRLPPTVVTQGITLWETGLVHVNLEECGLGVNQHVKVCCC